MKTKRNMKEIVEMKAIACFVLMISSGTCLAQSDVEASVEAGLVSKYMWRGRDMGGVSLQPAATIGWQGLSLRASGSTGFDKEDGEGIDLQLGYSLCGFSLGVIDYWHTGNDKDNRYMKFDRDEGPHRMEGYIGYTCHYFGLHAYTTFWGEDNRQSGERAYSTYIEAAVPFRLGGIDWLVKAGMTPFESGSQKVRNDDILNTNSIWDDDYLYADGPACVMASVRATKQFHLGEVRLPVFTEFYVNPYLQRTNVLLGISVVPF